jgi:hypothetical protein
MATKFLIDGPARAKHTILLAHGAGGPMDSLAMTSAAKALADSGFRVARFEFDYMAARRSAAGRKPPPRADKLGPEYLAAVDELGPSSRDMLDAGGRHGARPASAISRRSRRRPSICRSTPGTFDFPRLPLFGVHHWRGFRRGPGEAHRVLKGGAPPSSSTFIPTARRCSTPSPGRRAAARYLACPRLLRRRMDGCPRPGRVRAERLPDVAAAHGLSRSDPA